MAKLTTHGTAGNWGTDGWTVEDDARLLRAYHHDDLDSLTLIERTHVFELRSRINVMPIANELTNWTVEDDAMLAALAAIDPIDTRTMTYVLRRSPHAIIAHLAEMNTEGYTNSWTVDKERKLAKAIFVHSTLDRMSRRFNMDEHELLRRIAGIRTQTDIYYIDAEELKKYRRRSA